MEGGKIGKRMKSQSATGTLCEEQEEESEI
jgi:hypothetical protein